jgi:phage terminase large subunit-like protein
MQRIDNHDLSGYLLRGGNGEKWHHLNLPVIIDHSTDYPDAYTHGIPIEHDLPEGWLWSKKHNDTHREGLISHKRTYYCQYMQDPLSVSVEGALWSQESIDKYRVTTIDTTTLERIIVANDPSGDDGKVKKKKADEIGIVASGRRMEADGLYHYYIFDDCSMNGSPAQWGKATVDCYNKHKASLVVAEGNFGGAMVENTLRTVDGGANIAYLAVTSSRGKLIRAEPASSLSERGLLHIVGNMPILEQEMTTYAGKGKSPNRLDAAVFGINELMEPTATSTTHLW